MSDETLDFVARRSQLLLKKDQATKANRRAADEAKDARVEMQEAESELLALEKEEIKALRQ